MKTSKSLNILSVAVLVVLFSSSLLAQWQQDSKYGFKIKIPSSWSKNSHMDGTDKVYDYMSADENTAIQLRAFDAGAGFTTALLAQVYEENMLPAGTKKLSLDEHTTANGIPCKKGVYLLDYNGNEVGLSALYIIENNKGFVLTAIIPSSMIQQKGEELKQIVKSFSIDGFEAKANNKPSGLGGLLGGTSSNDFKINSITLTDQIDAYNNALNPTNSFNTKTDEILAVVKYTGKAKTDLTVSWIYDDWNRTISTDDFVFTDNAGGKGVVSLTKPTNDWPVGNYTIKFEMDGKIIQQLDFTVSKQSSSGGNSTGGSTYANNKKFIIKSHQTYDFITGSVVSLAKSTGGGFAIFSYCNKYPEVGGKFIITNSNSFKDVTTWNKSALANVGRYDRRVVPVNRVCVFETRDGTYAKFMFTKSDYNPNGCTHTLTCVVEYPISNTNNSTNSGYNNIAGKYNLQGRSDGKVMVEYHFIKINKDGTYREEYSLKNSGGYISKNAGVWKVNGNNLTLTQRYGGVSDSYKIKGNKIIRTSEQGTVFTFVK